MTPEENEEFNRIEMESRIKQEYVRSMKQEMVPMEAVLQMRDYIRELEWAIKELRERIVELGGSTKNKWDGLTVEEVDNITAQRLKWQVSDLADAIEEALRRKNNA